MKLKNELISTIYRYNLQIFNIFYIYIINITTFTKMQSTTESETYCANITDKLENLNINNLKSENFTEESKIPNIKYEFLFKKYSPNRINNLNEFFKYLYKHRLFAKENEEKQIEIIKDLEKSCYKIVLEKARKDNIQTNWSNETFKTRYEYNCGRIKAYLDYELYDPEKVDIIIRNFLYNKSAAREFPFKSHKDFFPEQYKILNERNNANSQKNKKYSKLYTCPNCKRNKSTTKNIYIRSLDEGTNVKATCGHCNNEWLV